MAFVELIKNKYEGEIEPHDSDVEGSGWSRLIRTPFFFFGLAFYRAWIEIGYVGSFIKFPYSIPFTHNIFDIVMAVTLLLAVIFHRHLTPLSNKKWVYGTGIILFIISTTTRFASLFVPQYAQALALPSIIGGGISVAIIILLWSEFYSQLNPYRVAVYYSTGILLGAFVIYFCKGMAPLQLTIATILLPLISIFCVWRSFDSLSLVKSPALPYASFTFPWKPVMLMATYAFAYGLIETSLYISTPFGPHSAPGTVVAAVIVLAGMIFRGRYFNLNVIWRIALPAMVCAFLLIPLFPDNEFIAAVFGPLSYTSFSIITMLIIANLCYRYNISPVWLFGIERSTRVLFSIVGRAIASIDTLPDYVTVILASIGILTATIILYSEGDITSRWGLTLSNKKSLNTVGLNQDQMSSLSLTDHCQAISKEYDLTKREREVFYLLAKGRSISEIADDLYIANGTTKAHVRNIYKKLGIHSRDELHKLTEK